MWSKHILCGLILLLGLALIKPVHSIPNLSIDGAGSNTCLTATTCSLTPFTTSNPNDVIIVFATTNTAVSLNTPTDSQGQLSFTLRETLTPNAVTDAEYSAVASTPLSGDTIEVTTSGPADISLVVEGISGADTVAPFDPSSAVPATSSGTTPSCPLPPCSDTVSVLISSTANADDLILGLVGDASPVDPLTAGSGFSLVTNQAGEAAAEFEVVSSTQSGLSVEMGLTDLSSGGIPWVMIGDAVQAPARLAVSHVPVGGVMLPGVGFTVLVPWAIVLSLLGVLSVEAFLVKRGAKRR